MACLIRSWYFVMIKDIWRLWDNMFFDGRSNAHYDSRYGADRSQEATINLDGWTCSLCKGSLRTFKTSLDLWITPPRLKGTEDGNLFSLGVMYYDQLGLTPSFKYMDRDRKNGRLDKHHGLTFLCNVLWPIRINTLIQVHWPNLRMVRWTNIFLCQVLWHWNRKWFHGGHNPRNLCGVCDSYRWLCGFLLNSSQHSALI